MADRHARSCACIHKAFRQLTILVGSLVLLHGARGATAQGGAWSVPYDWPYAIQSAGGVQDKEISHAALIPAGLHAGKVLLFSWKADHHTGTLFSPTSSFWFFNPDAPTDLTLLEQQLNANDVPQLRDPPDRADPDNWRKQYGLPTSLHEQQC